MSQVGRGWRLMRSPTAAHPWYFNYNCSLSFTSYLRITNTHCRFYVWISSTTRQLVQQIGLYAVVGRYLLVSFNATSLHLWDRSFAPENLRLSLLQGIRRHWCLRMGWGYMGGKSDKIWKLSGNNFAAFLCQQIANVSIVAVSDEQQARCR